MPSTYQYIAAGQNLPKYLAKTGYKEPTSSEDSNYAASDPDGLKFFSRLQRSPEYYDAFTGHMEAWTAWKTPWTKLYDASKLIEGADLSKPLVVDVGGNTGIDISHVLVMKPELPSGVLILQDLPEIIEKVEGDERITAQAHDFFKPQPVIGASTFIVPMRDTDHAQGAEHISCTPFSTTGPTLKLYSYLRTQRMP